MESVRSNTGKVMVYVNLRNPSVSIVGGCQDASASGVKNFEIRKDDRGYRVGDILKLAEWDAELEKYTGRRHWKMISYILRDEGYLALGHVYLGVFPIPKPTWEGEES